MEILARTVAATRSYGPVTAVDAVSLDVPAGQLLGLLGPNGAGKTTLLQLLTGLRRPTSGTVELFGGDPRDAAMSWDDHLANIDMERFMEARAAAVGLDDLAELGLDDGPGEPLDDEALRFWAGVEGEGNGTSFSRRDAVERRGTRRNPSHWPNP